jgi:hypothetical protein
MLEEDAGSSFFSEDELTLVSFEDDSIEASSDEEEKSLSEADEELSSPQATISRAVVVTSAKSFLIVQPFINLYTLNLIIYICPSRRPLWLKTTQKKALGSECCALTAPRTEPPCGPESSAIRRSTPEPLNTRNPSPMRGIFLY